MKENQKKGKLIIFSAPSGAGKTTIVRHAMERLPELAFSVSATSRRPRPHETDGKDYYFFHADDFKKAVSEDKFIEWEEVYEGAFYGTLVSELERLWSDGKTILFDVDVKGALNLKKKFGEDALAVFVMPPSVEVLRQRLEKRGTESPEDIDKRVRKAEYELGFADEFDYILVNKDLIDATDEIETVLARFLKGN